ncbi:hypothetical protein D3C74_387310 [compost metagenome]
MVPYSIQHLRIGNPIFIPGYKSAHLRMPQLLVIVQQLGGQPVFHNNLLHSFDRPVFGHIMQNRRRFGTGGITAVTFCELHRCLHHAQCVLPAFVGHLCGDGFNQRFAAECHTIHSFEHNHIQHPAPYSE